MKKERVFSHSRFNDKINAARLAGDIIKNIERGSATAKKIVTVLQKIHKAEGISSLNRISHNVIANFENYLKNAVNNKELAVHTAQGYASALNAISQYINLRTDKNLPEISLGIKNKLVFGGKSTPQELYDKVYSKLSESNQIKQELQRNLFLRARESHYIKAGTIKNALETGILKLNKLNNDGTKNSRPREIKIRTFAQRKTLTRALNYMEKMGQKSMIENNKTYPQAFGKYYRDIANAGGTRAANNGNNFSHGNRHYGINYSADVTLPNEGITGKNIDRIISSEAGHGEVRTTAIYRGKH